MISRRQFCISAGIFAGIVSGSDGGDARAKALDDMSPPSFRLPENATDCHVHIFDPVRFSYSQNRRYTPPPATVNDLLAFHRGLGIRRVVLVQPSVYGTDNRCLLDALKRLGKSARGVAVISEKISQVELADMAAQGVRGVRINLEVAHDRNADDAIKKFERTVRQIDGHGLLIQVYGALPVIAALAPAFMQHTQPVIVDHYALAHASAGVTQDGFNAITSMLTARRAYVKLSGPYQISNAGPAYADIAPVARALIQAAPEQAIWGSDWPHTGGANRPLNYNPKDIELFRQEDDGRNLGLLKDWAPSPEIRQKILVDNPGRLFNF